MIRPSMLAAFLLLLLAGLLVGCGPVTRFQPNGPDANFEPARAVLAKQSATMGVTLNPDDMNRFEALLAQAERLKPGGAEAQTLRARYQGLKELQAIRLQQAQSARLDELPETFVNSVGITMKLIRPGTFAMGSDKGGSDELPITQVTFTRPFYIGVYEVTEKQYAAVMGGAGTDAPKTSVSWNEAMEFCQRLSAKEGISYTLPTEAQWEYACRAGTTTAYSFGDSWSGELARQPNPWGLYDMHGNVWEWCLDWYADKLPGGSVTDPTGPSSGSLRVFRGGGWCLFPRLCRSAIRNWVDPGNRFILGFRAVAAVQ